MRTRTCILSAVGVAAITVAGTAVYRIRTAGHAQVRDITERVAAAMSAGDRAALNAEPAFRDHPRTADWLAARGPALAAGYRVSVQRNGANGYQLMSLELVSHVGVIKTATGDISLGFWRDPGDGVLKFVTAASTSIGPAGADPAGGGIRVGDQAVEPRAAADRGGM